MRITFVTRRYWPAIGGVERVAMSLGETLSGHGHDVTVIAQCVDEGDFGRMTHVIRENKIFRSSVHNGVRVRQFRPSRKRRSLLLPLAFELIPLAGRASQRYLRRYTSGYYAKVVESLLAPLIADADVVHVLGGEAMAVAAVEVARRLGKPVAISPFAHPGDWGMDSGSIRAYRSADIVIATTKADASTYLNAGVAADRVRIVGLPVTPGPPGGDAEAVPESNGEAPLTLFLGARRPTKGIDILLAAARLVWKQHPSARFAFVGPGEALPDRDQRLLDVGRVSDAERSVWLSRAQLLCLPSSGESFGLVVPEAWSHGVPVVVSDIPVLKELVDVSGGGVTAARRADTLADAICRMLDDPARALALGQSGRNYWLANLTPLAVAQRHLGIYEELRADAITGHAAGAGEPLA